MGQGSHGWTGLRVVVHLADETRRLQSRPPCLTSTGSWGRCAAGLGRPGGRAALADGRGEQLPPCPVLGQGLAVVVIAGALAVPPAAQAACIPLLAAPPGAAAPGGGGEGGEQQVSGRMKPGERRQQRSRHGGITSWASICRQTTRRSVHAQVWCPSSKQRHQDEQAAPPQLARPHLRQGILGKK